MIAGLFSWTTHAVFAIGVISLSSKSALEATAPTPTPLSYSTTFTDPSGTPQSVSFTGTASGTSLTGTLTANGAAGASHGDQRLRLGHAAQSRWLEVRRLLGPSYGRRDRGRPSSGVMAPEPENGLNFRYRLESSVNVSEFGSQTKVRVNFQTKMMNNSDEDDEQ